MDDADQDSRIDELPVPLAWPRRSGSRLVDESSGAPACFLVRVSISADLCRLQNSIKYTIEVKAKRKEKLAANPKIVIPIRIRRPTRLALTAQLQKSGTHRRSTDGEVSIDGEWMTVEAAQPVDGIDCMVRCPTRYASYVLTL